MASWSRREYLALSMGAAVTACSGQDSAPSASTPAGDAIAAADGAAAAGDFVPLHELARQKGIRFGTAMAAYQTDDAAYAQIVRRECDVIVAENEHKWYTIHPEPDVWNFDPADRLVNFARSNELLMRGHTLIWHHPRWFPDWVNNLDFANAAQAEAMLDDYIARVAGRYHPFVYSWDVINETIDDKTGELRETSFSKVMGPEVIDYCFYKAKEYAPNATLAYNDYMSWESGNENHRTGVLRLLERLKTNGVPIDALGIQSHSNYDMPNEFTGEKQRAWRAFVDEAVGMGLEIYLTEFDVNDTEMGPDIATRDAAIASYTRDYLDLMFSYEETKELLMWGMVDKYSWLQNFLPREDGVMKRPTLYDENYQAKAMRDAVGEAIKAAPVRDPGKADPIRGRNDG